MLDKCCVFNYRSNYDKDPKESDFSSPTRQKNDLRQPWIRNRRRNYAYVENILNHIIVKQGLKENYID